MKKIVVYSTQLLPTGGIESHILEFCNQMKARDILIDLVVLNSKILPSTKEYYLKACRNVYLGSNKSSLKRLIWLIFIAVKLQFSRYDALYTNGQGESIMIFARMLRFKRGWIHHHHTSGDKEDQATWGKRYLDTLMEADSVIACSSRNATQMSHALGRSIDTIPCFSRKITVKRPITINPEKIKFGYYGRLIPEKGIDFICKMSDDIDLPNVEFHIWGEGESYPPSFFEKFPRVNYHGTFYGMAGLSETIASIDAYLLISVHPEGLPISLLEAMSSGLPWLATDQGGIPDIACDPLSTRVIPADSNYDQVKQAIKLFAEDLVQGKISRQAQERLYTEKFSAPVLVQRWREALKLN